MDLKIIILQTNLAFPPCKLDSIKILYHSINKTKEFPMVRRESLYRPEINASAA